VWIVEDDKNANCFSQESEKNKRWVFVVVLRADRGVDLPALLSQPKGIEGPPTRRQDNVAPILVPARFPPSVQDKSFRMESVQREIGRRRKLATWPGAEATYILFLSRLARLLARACMATAPAPAGS